MSHWWPMFKKAGTELTTPLASVVKERVRDTLGRTDKPVCVRVKVDSREFEFCKFPTPTYVSEAGHETGLPRLYSITEVVSRSQVKQEARERLEKCGQQLIVCDRER